MPKRPLSWRRGVIFCLAEAGLLLGLAAGMVWLDLTTQRARQALSVREQQAEQALSGVSETAVLQAEADSRRAVLQKIAHLVPPERSLGDVIAALEGEAKDLRVQLAVPLVEEADGEEAGGEAGAVLRDVHLQLIVSGEPERLLSFFHAVEHLPYLLRVDAWHLTTTDEPARREAQALPPAAGPGESESLTPSAPAELTLDVFLSIMGRERNVLES